MVDVDSDSLGSRISKQRIERNLTQKQLAELMEFSVSTISAWETDRQTPSRDTLRILGRMLRVDPDYLRHGNIPVPVNDEEMSLVLTPSELRALKVFRSAPPRAHEAMIAVLRVTAKFAGGAAR
jgi:transcriptional regulator with XRE-family HTH domain